MSLTKVALMQTNDHNDLLNHNTNKKTHALVSIRKFNTQELI